MSPTKAQSTPTTSEPPASPFKFSFSEFDNVDHRLKLYLYQSVFEDDNEQLKWLVRGQILLEKPAADGRWRRGAAVFVMSTTKFYVLQIVGNEWYVQIANFLRDALEIMISSRYRPAMRSMIG